MLETLQDGESRASSFTRTHVSAPNDYETYRFGLLEQWRADTADAVARGDSTKPMWLRRNGETSAEFAAHIDYVVPLDGKVSYLAAIDIDGGGGNTEIQVWLPKEDGSGEPIVATCEPYNLETLDQAIALIEASVVPTLS